MRQQRRLVAAAAGSNEVLAVDVPVVEIWQEPQPTPNLALKERSKNRAAMLVEEQPMPCPWWIVPKLRALLVPDDVIVQYALDLTPWMSYVASPIARAIPMAHLDVVIEAATIVPAVAALA